MRRFTIFANSHLIAVLALAMVSPLTAPSFGQAPKRKAKASKPTKPMVRSIVMDKSLEDSQAQGFFDDAVGMINAKRYSEAAAKFEEALPLLRNEANRRGEATVLNNVGVAYALGGEHAKAVDYYQQSLDVAAKEGLDDTQASVLYNLGVATYKLDKDPAIVLDYFDRALVFYQKLGNKTGEADTLFNIGQVYQWSGDAAKAKEYYDRSLRVRVQ